MAVQIPPWLNIDPLAPARIRLQANAQRNAADASIRAAQAHAQELQFQRENADAHERAALRRDEVLKQTHDNELAQAAQVMQLRRESQARMAQQFQQQLRFRQQKAEGEAATAAKQMEGLQSYQKAIQSGVPHAKALMDNADKLFAKDPTKAFQAMPQAIQEPRMINVKDEQGNPTGVMAIPGRAGVNVQKPSGLDARGQALIDRAMMSYYAKQILEGDETPAEKEDMKRELKALRDKMKNPASYQSQPLPGPLPPRTPAVVPGAVVPLNPVVGPGIPLGRGAVASPAGVNAQALAAAPAPPSDTVRVTSPNGKIGTIPRSQLPAAVKAGYEEVSPSPAEESNFTEESDTAPEDNQEE